jgi:FixJ family two-component response regulator
MGRTILVVDDDRGFRRGLERLLRAYGLEVRGYGSAEEFQATAEPGAAACLILDISLGGMSGIELRRRLRDSGCNAPVVFVTADDREQTRSEALNAGCLAYLEKPFPASELLHALDQGDRTLAEPRPSDP